MLGYAVGFCPYWARAESSSPSEKTKGEAFASPFLFTSQTSARSVPSAMVVRTTT